MKLNLGCGSDLRDGYVNVDQPGLVRARGPEGIVIQPFDLSMLPWPWKDGSADEILMLDFLEHFSYRKTEAMLAEVWRVLGPTGHVDIQVPDFEQCARASCRFAPYDCNKCGHDFLIVMHEDELLSCPDCGQTHGEIADAALNRLYGGQDYAGNWHHTAFTMERLTRLLTKSGFGGFEFLEREHQRKNWNFKIRARKTDDVWSDA